MTMPGELWTHLKAYPFLLFSIAVLLVFSLLDVDQIRELKLPLMAIIVVAVVIQVALIIAKVQGRQRKVEFLMQHFITKHERNFLERLNGDGPFKFSGGHRDIDHLRRLRDLEFIGPRKGKTKHIAQLKEGENVKEFFEVMEPGKVYLEFALEQSHPLTQGSLEGLRSET